MCLCACLDTCRVHMSCRRVCTHATPASANSSTSAKSSAMKPRLRERSLGDRRKIERDRLPHFSGRPIFTFAILMLSPIQNFIRRGPPGVHHGTSLHGTLFAYRFAPVCQCGSRCTLSCVPLQCIHVHTMYIHTASWPLPAFLALPSILPYRAQ